jgi:hypothetical protein
MALEKLSNRQLEGCRKALEHAKANRPGGLLVTEQMALDEIVAEIERRNDDDR